MAKDRAIFDEGDDREENVEIRINEKFAKKYHEKKRHEELQNLKNVDLSEDEEESDSETEDEDGDQLTEDLDKDISRTLKMIRKKDPSIYDKSITFFKENSDDEEEEDEEKSSKKQKKNKPMYYKDLVRQQVLAGDISDSESDDEPVTTFAEEQQKLKGEFLKSVEDNDGNDSDDLDGGLFTKRKKTADEEEAEARDYEEFKETHAINDENLDADAFLAKYMKSGAWKERREIPRYDEIVGNGVDDDEDEEELDKADAFEHAYNFRFEEEGGGQIQTFSRHIEDSMRRKDDKRKIAREERKARKALERQKKEEELRRLKNLKQAEIQSKLDKVMALMGESSKTLTAADIDGEFDPEEHDRRMAQVFDDEYYGGDGGQVDEKKPTWDDDDEIFGKLPEEEEEDEGDEDGSNPVEEEVNEDEDMEEADENEEQQEEEEEEEMPMTREEMEAKKKQYLDELYALDYEDLIGDLPCRFKYRQVEKNDYGLTTRDILFADDQELKTVVSLKRLAPYADREYSANRRKVQQLRKALREKELKNKKKQAAEEAKEEATEEDQTTADEGSKKKRKRRGKKSKESKDEVAEEPAEEDEETNDKEEDAPAKKKRKHKKKKSKTASSTPAAALSASRLESYRLKPLK